jgi:hypothetical protein
MQEKAIERMYDKYSKMQTQALKIKSSFEGQ